MVPDPLPLHYSSPVLTGEEGLAAKRWEVRVCSTDSAKTLTSQAVGLGSLLSREKRERRRVGDVIL